MVCPDSKRQKANKKMWVFIVLGTTRKTCEIFPGSQEKKKANTNTKVGAPEHPGDPPLLSDAVVKRWLQVFVSTLKHSEFFSAFVL